MTHDDFTEDIFTGMKELLDGGKGWGKGEFYPPEGYCVLGAAIKVRDGIDSSVFTGQLSVNVWKQELDITTEMGRVAKELFPDRLGKVDASDISPRSWLAAVNDHPHTVFTDIEQIIDKTHLRIQERVAE